MSLLDKYPDLKAGMQFELARNRNCSDCSDNAIRRRWMDKARARDLLHPSKQARRQWRSGRKRA